MVKPKTIQAPATNTEMKIDPEVNIVIVKQNSV